MARWQLFNSGYPLIAPGIEWIPTPGEAHTDDIEMAGFGCSDTVTYGVDENGILHLSHHPVFPTLRRRPNDTHASFQLDMPSPVLLADGAVLREMVDRVTIDSGVLAVYTHDGDISVVRTCYPAYETRAAYEQILVSHPAWYSISMDTSPFGKVKEEMGPMGICTAEMRYEAKASDVQTEFTVQYAGRYANEPVPKTEPLSCRRVHYEALTAPMHLETGDPVLDTLFHFAKLRAGESVFDTKFGKIHSPGGKSYYAATWCNDQVEYAGPYFACTGDEILLEASMNAYRMYIPFMSDSFTPIPSSVIAEGLDYWNGAGDRGDAAMYLYGASRFVLTCGREDWARELLPAIRWCAEYCRRKKNECGVIASDSDELEGRFSSGKMNLNTSCLALAGYRYASLLCRDLGISALADEYAAEAEALSAAIESTFGRTIHGFDTYAYHDGCEVLRSWICMPLCAGLYSRAEGTVAALTSDYLFRRDGMLTTEDNGTIWDRSTLYALRGLYAAGYTEKATECLRVYSENRLLGERVPYPVEAYPEGGKRHLSGESALYCKIFTEGMLGLEPVGLRRFTLCPRLPETLDHLYMTGIHAHGGVFDIKVEKDGYKVLRNDGTLLAEGKPGEKCAVTL
ncbi:MAG: hypothetical protein IJ480_11685 [Clostridia bacterium]|nr:hypothetical protein [Clostridia bacterium]